MRATAPKTLSPLSASVLAAASLALFCLSCGESSQRSRGVPTPAIPKPADEARSAEAEAAETATAGCEDPKPSPEIEMVYDELTAFLGLDLLDPRLGDLVAFEGRDRAGRACKILWTLDWTPKCKQGGPCLVNLGLKVAFGTNLNKEDYLTSLHFSPGAWQGSDTATPTFKLASEHVALHVDDEHNHLEFKARNKCRDLKLQVHKVDGAIRAVAWTSKKTNGASESVHCEHLQLRQICPAAHDKPATASAISTAGVFLSALAPSGQCQGVDKTGKTCQFKIKRVTPPAQDKDAKDGSDPLALALALNHASFVIDPKAEASPYSYAKYTTQMDVALQSDWGLLFAKSIAPAAPVLKGKQAFPRCETKTLRLTTVGGQLDSARQTSLEGYAWETPHMTQDDECLHLVCR